MQTHIEKWEDVPLVQHEKNVFHLQRRIFTASQNGNRKQVHHLQKLLLCSFAAKCLAVAKVTEKNAGRQTAGVDHERGLSDQAKLALANGLSLRQPISPVRRVEIPKPGTCEKRPLGIPTIKDRALQALIALALEPEWEAHFSPGMYGFRKGRSVRDAIANIRSSIQNSPKWVFDADIEKFFDRVNHDTLLAKLDTFPSMETAIRRILQSGVLQGEVLIETEKGTPQGGPLSPLLANIVLCGLETDLTTASHTWKLSNGKRPKGTPKVYQYADDFNVLHKERETVERCRDFIAAWLQPYGLSLHPQKTRIVHTLETNAGCAGFDFLGHHIQQFHTGKYAVKACFKKIYTHITPSRKSAARVYNSIAHWISKILSCRSKLAGTSPEEILIHRINPIITGWANFFRHCNAKCTFSRLDSLIWHKLRKALFRRHKRKGRTWTAQTFLRLDGKWRFHCQTSGQKPVVLHRFADTAIQRHFPVRIQTSYYDGDWAYWGTRLGRYPGLATAVSRLLKQQRGQCSFCRNPFNKLQKAKVVSCTPEGSIEGSPKFILVHDTCNSTERRTDGLKPQGPAIEANSSPMH